VALAWLEDPPRDIAVLPFLDLVLVWNRGVSFGLFNRESELAPWVLIGLALAIVVGLLVWVGRLRGRWPIVAVGLVIGGAIGNSIDRLRHGAVVDFIDLHVAAYHWPAFNVADSAIVIGVGILLLDGLFGRHDQVKSP
jgi:signal peptidase II